MDKQKSIVWFRKDLRVSDNPALAGAIKAGEVIPIYIFDEYGADYCKMGSHARWWLAKSLEALSESLEGGLHVFQGHSLEIIENIIKKTGATSVFWNRCYEPWIIKRDTKIKKTLLDQGINVQSFNAYLLWEPHEIVKTDGTAYKVFTPFFKNGCLKAQAPREIISKPKNINFCKMKLGISIVDLQLIDKKVDQRLSKYWQPGEKEAMKRLKYFIKHDLSDYKEGRNFPAKDVTSKLSPYLHFGEISPNQMWYLVQDLGYDYASRENIQTFLTELGWREFAYNVLFFNYDMPRKNLNKKFDKITWKYDKKLLQFWTQGQTGYPIIDAAMRELYHTGFMHNRMRMVVASFLVKNLMIHWHAGEDWFWDLLVDADLASNSFNWQWVAGCGYDATPYFRIFNPILQAKKFDSRAEYIRQWVPELAKLSVKYIFEPYNAPDHILTEAGIVLGKTYPKPMIDLAISSKCALELFKQSFKHS
ncbi:deoxyribodipyrimidine photo-lyase [Candidatus Dependentiae bacterium]|nr:deoxyribodipyrimidine photo-lyase [Candidatus Dependentiae bacterium]